MQLLDIKMLKLLGWLTTYESVNAMLKVLKISLLITIAQLVGCSTIAGLGEDIKKSAEWAKEKLPSTEVNK